jgi:ankyrin repeat protein
MTLARRIVCVLAIMAIAASGSGGLFRAAQGAPATKPPRNEAKDRRSIELAKAIMSGDRGFKELIAGADPNAEIFIDYQGQRHDVSLLTMATLLGDREVVKALIDAGVRRGPSCEIGHLVAASFPLNSILPQFTDRRAGLPSIMEGQAAMSCFLAAPYREAAVRSDQKLLDAVAAGDLKAVKRAVARGGHSNARERKLPGNVVWPGRSILMMALIEGRPDVAEFLISIGADVKAKAAIASRWGGVDGIDALKIAVHLEQRTILSSLLRHGADPAAVDEAGNRAVHEAAAAGDAETLSILLAESRRLDAKSSIIARNASGQTPLVLAVRSHRLEAVAQIVRRGKETYGGDFLEYWGSAAIDEALTLRLVGSLSAVEIEGTRRGAGTILSFLLENGADASMKDGQGRTILMRALDAGFDVTAIRSILGRKPQLEAVDRDGKDAYSVAASREDAAQLKVLLDDTREGGRQQGEQ